MNAALLSLLVVFAASRAALAQPAAEEKPKELLDFKDHYKKAFEYFTAGSYSEAVNEWNEVLKIDAEQNTALKMIREARKKIDDRDSKEQAGIFEHAAQGQYQSAFLKLQPLLDRDGTHPLYLRLQNRLELLTEIVKKAPLTRDWRAAVRGLTGYIAKEDDLQLAYNGLRHAKDLNPGEPSFDKIIVLLLKEDKRLAEDRITPGMKLLEYKRFSALNQIYDGKYHLAVQTLNQVLALEPNDLDSLKRLGSAYYQLKNYKQAREVWRRALALAPTDKSLKKFLARAERGLTPPRKPLPRKKR